MEGPFRVSCHKVFALVSLVTITVAIASPATAQDARSQEGLAPYGTGLEPRSNSPAPIAPAPNSTLEIPQVPKVFEGCWQGVVMEPDSWEHLEGPGIAGWIPANYEICFRRTAERPFEITFTKTTVDTNYAASRGYPVRNVESHTELLSSDGRSLV